MKLENVRDPKGASFSSNECSAADFRRLDVVNVPLQGLNMIEANAGTGKTWTITALYVRLLLEAGRSVDSILVVTFTEAATGELRDRIRNRLAEVRDVFESGRAEDSDELMTALLSRIGDHPRALSILKGALIDFDQASIYTIHGFCQRVLSDNAFESGMPFHTDILVDQSALLREIVDDFWRCESAIATPLFTRFLLKKRVNPGSLVTELERYIGKPYLQVRVPNAAENVVELESAYHNAFKEARRLWLSERETIAVQLVGNPNLHGSKYRRDYVTGWLQQMDECLRCESPGLDLCRQFEKFTPDVLRGSVKDGKTAPSHPFYDACALLMHAHHAIDEAYERCLPIFKSRLLAYCNVELVARKQRRELQSYDDLLLNLDEALHAERGDMLAQAVRERYPAALIDEFQDTDPVQYSIFRAIYAGIELPVFLVGDPKQSIFGFRGADVFSYLGARRDARSVHTLDKNWRSEPALLDAVNLMFQNAPDPFVIRDIPYQPSAPANGARGQFVVDGESAAPFQIWFSESADAYSKDDMKALASRATAAEIARLLNLGARGMARIEGEDRSRTLRGGDIAVLVRTHDQAQWVCKALSELGVASVQRGGESVFATREAEELERVLVAIAEPGREALIGAALSTEILGLPGAELHALQADESRWEEVVETFRDAHNEWREAGFIPMLRKFFNAHDVLYRLLEYIDGERRVTNLLHLSEVLHCQSDKQGIGGLLASLSAKRKAPSKGNLEELLRLESDENLVKILTVHTAKGLEFPLVFCPFMWDGNLRSASANTNVITFHEADRTVVDLGSETFDQSRSQAVLEERAESMRLLYVALTRAKFRCWMVWGKIRDAEASPPAWLLHRSVDETRPGAELKALLGEPTHPSFAHMRADLQRLETSSNGALRVVELSTLIVADRFEPVEVTAPVLHSRAFTGAIRDTRRVTSFTGLTHGRPVEAADYDAAIREPQLEKMPAGHDIFAFPRGAQAGKCLHAIFENVDFMRLVRPELERTVGHELSAHGLEAKWVEAVADMVEWVVATPLDSSGLRLEQVPLAKRRDELEFYYPLANLSHARLKQILLESNFPGDIRQRIGELTFASMQGYMRGFIDIVFEHAGRYYLADYKSNWLGPTIDAYQQDALAKAMGREAYFLQYLVYCVALHRYLKLRVQGYRYDTHFGGVRYLFVRGMRPDSGATRGVYADHPPRALIETLDRYLQTGSL